MRLALKCPWEEKGRVVKAVKRRAGYVGGYGCWARTRWPLGSLNLGLFATRVGSLPFVLQLPHILIYYASGTSTSWRKLSSRSYLYPDPNSSVILAGFTNISNHERCGLLSMVYSHNGPVVVEKRIQRRLSTLAQGLDLVGHDLDLIVYAGVDGMIGSSIRHLFCLPMLTFCTGHLNLFIAGFLHRDPSVGNVLIDLSSGVRTDEQILNHDCVRYVSVHIHDAISSTPIHDLQSRQI